MPCIYIKGVKIGSEFTLKNAILVFSIRHQSSSFIYVKFLLSLLKFC